MSSIQLHSVRPTTRSKFIEFNDSIGRKTINGERYNYEEFLNTDDFKIIEVIIVAKDKGHYVSRDYLIWYEDVRKSVINTTVIEDL